MDFPPPSSGSPPTDWPTDWFEQVTACLWCSSDRIDPCIAGVRDWFFGCVPGEFSFGRCRECGSLLLQSRPTAAHLAKAYRGYYTHTAEQAGTPGNGLVQRMGRVLANGYARRRYGQSSRIGDAALASLFGLFPVRRAEIDAKHRHLPAAPADVLDYGCGNGEFLVRAAGLGHRIVGVDFDPTAVATARARGLAVFEPSAEQSAEFSARFALITAVHVLEHVPDPLALLRDFRRWLKPGGELFLEMPNAAAAGLGQHGKFWRGLEAPRHFSVPSEAGLRSALKQAGFAQVIIGQRAFARDFMDAASHAAAHGEGMLPLSQAVLSGPEVLTCLARAD